MGGALGFHYPRDGSLFVPRRVLQLVTLCCANSLTQLYQSTCSSRSVISISNSGGARHSTVLDKYGN